MRNYLRYLAYVLRYKGRIIGSIAAGLVCESLGFVSVVSFFATVQVLYMLHTTGEPGAIADHALLKTALGRRVLEFMTQRVVGADRLLPVVALCGACFLVLAGTQAVLDFFRRYLLSSASLRGWTDMIKDLFERVCALSSRFFSQQSLGHTMAPTRASSPPAHGSSSRTPSATRSSSSSGSGPPSPSVGGSRSCATS